MWSVVACLGEMTALFPVQGPLFEFPGRFIDEAVGYATGWISWFAWVVILAAEVLAVAQMWRFRFDEEYLRDVGYPEKELGWNTEGYRYVQRALCPCEILLIVYQARRCGCSSS
jgi:amino acid transporter